MNQLIIKKPNWLQAVSLTQLLLLFFYLALNIINVGENGTALPLLAGFVALSGGVFFLYLFSNKIAIRLHFFIFLLFILWLALRAILDLGDIEHLKQLTVATTGGVLLFFLIGTFTKGALDIATHLSKDVFYIRFLVLIFLVINIIIFFSFKSKLLDRADIFFIEGVDGSYQRPGNFLIMLFIIVSFIFVYIFSHPISRRVVGFLFWLAIYSLSLVLALISSQMIGSNAATANLIAIYLLTVVLAMVGFNKKIRGRFLNNRLKLPLSKSAFLKTIKYSIVSLCGGVIIATLAIQITGFDISKTRALGFGSGTNSSVSSRFDILLETGADQMGYAPLLGNMNVAKLTTGVSGRTLHSFIPNVFAELGLVGLLIVLLLFFLIFKLLIKNIKQSPKDEAGYIKAITNTWLFFVLVFLFFYANLAVGKSWPVLWFYLGFAVSVFVFNKSVRKVKGNISNEVTAYG